MSKFINMDDMEEGIVGIIEDNESIYNGHMVLCVRNDNYAFEVIRLTNTIREHYLYKKYLRPNGIKVRIIGNCVDIVKQFDKDKNYINTNSCKLKKFNPGKIHKGGVNSNPTTPRPF